MNEGGITGLDCSLSIRSRISGVNTREMTYSPAGFSGSPKCACGKKRFGATCAAKIRPVGEAGSPLILIRLGEKPMYEGSRKRLVGEANSNRNASAAAGDKAKEIKTRRRGFTANASLRIFKGRFSQWES